MRALGAGKRDYYKVELIMQNFSDSISVDYVKEAVKQGDCSVNTFEKLKNNEWKNQIHDKRTYFHLFIYDRGVSQFVSSMQLKSDPYRKVFRKKMSHMEENGMMGKMFLQLNPMKPMTSEKLKALELEHFYFVFIGICVGLAASLVSLLCEMLRSCMRKSNPN